MSAASSTTTLALIKPDAVAASAVADIEALITAHNFGILARMETQLQQPKPFAPRPPQPFAGACAADLSSSLATH